jgi:hypothetical protein
LRARLALRDDLLSAARRTTSESRPPQSATRSRNH